jgi:hypothetical protein
MEEGLIGYTLALLKSEIYTGQSSLGIWPGLWMYLPQLKGRSIKPTFWTQNSLEAYCRQRGAGDLIGHTACNSHRLLDCKLRYPTPRIWLGIGGRLVGFYVQCITKTVSLRSQNLVNLLRGYHHTEVLIGYQNLCGAARVIDGGTWTSRIRLRIGGCACGLRRYISKHPQCVILRQRYRMSQKSQKGCRKKWQGWTADWLEYAVS